jgi:hypothetical protein
MIPKPVEVQYLSDYRVWVRFADGVEGEVDLGDELWGEIFEPLKKKSEFARVYLHEELGTLVWPNGADFAPEFLYMKLRPHYALNSAPGNNVA